MRICLVSYDYPPARVGGIATYTYHLANGLAAAGQDVTVITDRTQFTTGKTAATGETSDPERIIANDQLTEGDTSASTGVPAVSPFLAHDHKVPFLGIMRGKGRMMRSVLNWSRSVDRTIAYIEETYGRFDIVEMPNSGGAGPEGFFYSLHSRAPLAIRLSTPIAHANSLTTRPASNLGLRLQSYLEGLAARRAHCLMSHSAHNAKVCADLYRLPLPSVNVVHLGIPLRPVQTLTRSYEDKTVRVLFVGRLQRRKGIHCLLQAIPQVMKKKQRVHFEIVGQDTGDAPQHGTYHDYFTGIAPQEAIEATTFHGRVDQCELSRLYAECDIVVAPSLSESYGLMYVEAMASAKPVIAFNSSAAQEIIEHNHTGVLVDTSNISKLANAITKLAGNPVLRREMGERGYQLARTQFSVDAMVSKTIGCYQRAVANFRPTVNQKN